MGWMTGDKYPLEHQMGPAVVIDVRSILDKAPNAKSPLITVDMIKADEAKNGEIKQGDVGQCTCTLRINTIGPAGRLSQEQKGIGERALMASSQPSPPW
jgi:hypothetical protein